MSCSGCIFASVWKECIGEKLFSFGKHFIAEMYWSVCGLCRCARVRQRRGNLRKDKKVKCAKINEFLPLKRYCTSHVTSSRQTSQVQKFEGKFEGKDHLEVLDIDGRILKWILII
jgi:hypothetical protein